MAMDHLSKSQISLYFECSLKYRFRYIDELPIPFKSSGLAFGSCIHSSIEWFHKQKMRGNDVSLEKFFQILKADWYSQKADTDILYKDGETEDLLLLKGKEIVSLYFERAVEKVVAAEYPFEVPMVNLGNGETLDIPLQGIIDLIEADDGIVEFKTGAKAMSCQEVQNNLQLTIYAYAYQMLFKKKPKTLKIVNLIKNKTPKMEIIETQREQKDFQRLFLLTKEVLKGIRSHVFYPRYSFFCKDCEYADYCRKWRGN